MPLIGRKTEDWGNIDIESNAIEFRKILDYYKTQSDIIHKGGGDIAIEKQHKKGRLTARERVDYLKDSNSEILEFGVLQGMVCMKSLGVPLQAELLYVS